MLFNLYSPVEPIWMGNAQSLAEVHHKLRLVETGVLKLDAMDTFEDDDEPPRNFTLQDGIGIIHTSGPLTNRDSFMSWLMGGTSYSTITSAFMEAAKDSRCTQILHIIDSGGGSASGVEDCGDTIRLIDQNVKPVTTYNSGTMSSAAYWLGAAAGKVYGSASCNTGSIGTRITLMNYVRAMQAEGVDAHVLSAGKYKTLGDPLLEWTPEAEAYWQSKIDALNEIFMRQMAEFRGVSMKKMKEEMAQGKEFVGTQAAQLNLIDGVTTLNNLVQSMQSKPRKLSMAKKKTNQPLMTAETLAEMAAGNVPALVDEEVVELTATQGEQEVAASAESSQEANQAPATTQEVATELVAAPAYPDLREVVTRLESSVKEKDRELLQVNVELSKVRDKLAQLESSSAGLLLAGQAAINLNYVRMGKPTQDLTTLNADQVVALWTKTSNEFTQAIPVGQHTHMTTDPSKTVPHGAHLQGNNIDRSLLTLPR